VTVLPRAALGVAGAALSLGCYSYAPASLELVPAGTPVRALLSTEAQVALRDSLGLEQQRVRGTLVERDGDRVLLAVRFNQGDWRVGSSALYQRIAVAPRDVLQLEVRRLNPGRTAGLFATLAAAATILAIEAYRKLNPGSPVPPGGGPPD
jgi:hypothetical protein